MKSERRQGRDMETARRAAMAALSAAPGETLKQLWQDAGLAIEGQPVRGPETGLITLRGRIGGGGAPFNFGEATVTRATVRLASGEVGHSYSLGRDKEKARLAAILDAAWQSPTWRSAVEEKIVAPLRAAAEAGDTRKRAETAATRVDFFTMVRGED